MAFAVVFGWVGGGGGGGGAFLVAGGAAGGTIGLGFTLLPNNDLIKPCAVCVVVVWSSSNGGGVDGGIFAAVSFPSAPSFTSTLISLTSVPPC